MCRAGVGRDRAAGSGGTAGKASGAWGAAGEAEKMGIDGKGLREICTTTEIHQHHFRRAGEVGYIFI